MIFTATDTDTGFKTHTDTNTAYTGINNDTGIGIDSTRWVFFETFKMQHFQLYYLARKQATATVFL